MIADGQHLYCMGEKKRGLEQINEAIKILRILGCDESATYYSNNLKEWSK